jgi:DNA-directed RNA polymerase specialized sigma subunit
MPLLPKLNLPAPGAPNNKIQKKESEREELMNAYKSRPDHVNLKAVLTAYDDVITKATEQFSGGYNSPVIKRRAQIMAAQALKSFDPTKGAKVSTHIYNSLQPIRRIAPAMTEAVVVPERVAIDMSKLDGADKELYNFLGRDPSDAELADRTGLSIKRIGKLRKMSMPINEGSFRDTENPDIVEAPGVNGRTNEQIMIDYVYHDLSPLDQKVLEMTSGYGGRPMLQIEQIATALNKPYKWVSQRASIIQKKVADAIGVARV